MSATDDERAEILEVITRLIREVVEEDWVTSQPIGFDTSFESDLELESIEVVALGERLREHYGERLDFAGWLSSMELPEMMNLQVGDVVDFVLRSR